MELNGHVNASEETRYIQFPQVKHGTLKDGNVMLNRFSTFLTRDHDFPGAQVANILDINTDWC
jgi:dihydroxy-acid dehydratase